MVFIVHLADLHIGSSNSSRGDGGRSEEYRRVFTTFFDHLSKSPVQDKILIVIAGDIFHHKVKYSGNDVADFNFLMDGLSKYPVVLICGNHDINVKNPAAEDLISPLVSKRSNVIYRRESGVFFAQVPLMNGAAEPDNLDCIDAATGLPDNIVKFLHVSVCDNFSTEHILFSVKQNPDAILLYHGMVNGTKMESHTVNNAVITQEILSVPHLVLLGDIHQHQFLQTGDNLFTAAYPGSLIQQNVGESAEKGYIIWNTVSRTGKFIRIHNDSGFLRLDLRGRNLADVEDLVANIELPQNLLKLTVVSDADDAGVSQIRNLVEAKCGTINKITQKCPWRSIDASRDQIDSLTEILQAEGATPSQVAAITQRHRTRLSEYNAVKWYVKSLEWSNLFRYGANNRIDFTKLSGISGVIAENRRGKSSILDILVFGLFNELLRGTYADVIRQGQTQASLTIDFVANGVQYRITRKITNRGNNEEALYRVDFVEKIATEGHSANVTDNITDNNIATDIATGIATDIATDIAIMPASVPTPKMEEKLTTLTGDTVMTTYRIVRTLIGSLSQFLATGLYYGGDHAVDLIRLGKTERLKTLTELFGLPDTDQLIKDIKSNIRDEEKKLSQLVRPRMDPQYASPHEHIAALASKIADIEATIANIDTIREALRQRIDAARTRLQSMESLPYDRATCLRMIEETKNLIAKLSAQKSLLDDKIRSVPPRDMAAIENCISSGIIPARKTKFTREQLMGFVNQKQNLIKDLCVANEVIFGAPAYLQDLMAHLEKSVTELKIRKGEICTLYKDTDNIDVLRSLHADASLKLQKISADITLHQQKIGSAPTEFATANVYAQWQADIATIDNKVTALRQKSNAAKMAALKQQQAQLGEKSSFKFDANCACCATNMRYIDRELANVTEQIRTCEVEAIELEAHNHKVAAERDQLIKQKEILRAKIDDYMAHQAALSALSQATLLHDQTAREIATLTEKMSQYEKSTAVLSLLTAAEASLAAVKSFNNATSELDTINILEFIDICKEQKAVTSALAEAQSRHNEHTRVLARLDSADYESPENLRGELVSWERDYDTVMREHYEATSMLQILRSEHARVQSEVAVYDEYHAKFTPIDESLAMLRLYKQCVESRQFRLGIIKKYMARVIDECNRILALMSDFNLTFDLSDNNIEILYEEKIMSAGPHTEDSTRIVKLPVSMASGFQKFIISVALRIAMTINLASSPDFLLIDEGFGCMDKTHLARVTDVFASVAQVYQFVFIISHIDDLQNIITSPIFIVERGGYSYLNNTYDTSNEITLASVVADLPLPVPTRKRAARVKTDAAVDNTDAADAEAIPVEVNTKVARRRTPRANKDVVNAAVDNDNTVDNKVVDNDNTATVSPPVDNVAINEAPVEANVDVANINDGAVICECGARIKPSSKSSHVKTAKHKAALTSKNK